MAEEEAADFCASAGFGADLEGATGFEGLHQEAGYSLDVVGRGWLVGGVGGAAFAAGRRFGLCVAGQFVEADGHGLAEVYGAMLFAGGDAEEIVAVAQVVIGEAEFFGAEEKSGLAGFEVLADFGGGLFEAD